MRVLMIGFGNVGQKIAELLSEPADKSLLFGLPPVFVGIFTARHGAVVDEQGLSASTCLEYFRNNNGFSASIPQYYPGSVYDAMDSVAYDVLVEVSTLSIANQGEPALSYTEKALKLGKHVILANKGPVAFAYNRLMATAREKKVLLLHESTVMDGTPVFNLARNGLIGCRVTGVAGILNSTTNFVLDGLRDGRSHDDVIREAQNLGVAEADPGLDLDGWDCAAKLSILVNALMGGDLTPADVLREKYQTVTPEMIRDAGKSGIYIRQVGRACYEKGQIKAQVLFRGFPANDPFAFISGTSSVLRIETDRMCPHMILQENPDIKDTAYGVIVDLMTISRFRHGKKF